MNSNVAHTSPVLSFGFFVRVNVLALLICPTFVCSGAELKKANAFWGKPSGEFETHVDICEKADVQAVLDRWKKKTGARSYQMIEVDKADVPDFSNSVGTLQMLTPQGRYEFKPERFTINEDGGCCLCVTLDSNFLKKLTGRSDVNYGFIGFGVKYSEKSTIEDLSKVKVDKKAFSKIAPQVYKTLTKNMSRKLKKDLKEYMATWDLKTKSTIGANDVKYVPLKSKKGRVWLTWIEDHLPRGSETSVSFSGAALFDDKGTLINMIEPIELKYSDAVQVWVPRYLTDLDGDGEQEVVVGIQYYEGAAKALYEPREGKMIRSETLAGWGYYK